MRSKQSSNRDLRMLSRLTGGGDFQKVNMTGVGMESVVTNSTHLANVLMRANCTSKEKVEAVLEAEVKGDDWESDMRGFEQHMAEEERVRVDW